MVISTIRIKKLLIVMAVGLALHAYAGEILSTEDHHTPVETQTKG